MRVSNSVIVATLINIHAILAILATPVFGIFIRVRGIARTDAIDVVVFSFDLARNRGRIASDNAIAFYLAKRLLRNWFYRLAVHCLEHLRCITLAEFHVGIVIEVIAVHAIALQVLGRGVIGVVHRVREFRHAVGIAAAFTQEFACHERHRIGAQVERLENIVASFLHNFWPVRVTAVRFALVEDDTLDNALFLRLFSDVDNRLRHVSVACIFFRVVLEPGFCRREISFVLVLVKELDARATHRDRDNPNRHVGHAVRHCAAKPVRHRNRVAAVKERRHCRVNVTERVAPLTRAFLRCENLEARIFGFICALSISRAAHIGLPVRNVNVEIRVWSSTCRNCTKRHQARSNACHGRKTRKLIKHSHISLWVKQQL